MRSIILALLLAAQITPGPTSPANGSVGTTKLADGAVTTAKLGAGAVTATAIGAGAVTTTQLGALSVTDAKVNDVAASKLTGTVAVTNGGTGANLSASTGLLKDAAGTVTAAALIDADVAAGAAIARSKIGLGAFSALVTDDGAGALSTLACASGQLVVANATPAPACVSLSSDATLAATGALTLASTGIVAASYGDASHV
ncbi:MAG TPA: hypothetical protein VMV41_11675, partial [Cellulomonadaceae bacterium]|nr:hypothetical protein [Cellulomonadaceae bacterium]